MRKMLLALPVAALAITACAGPSSGSSTYNHTSPNGRYTKVYVDSVRVDVGEARIFGHDCLVMVDPQGNGYGGLSCDWSTPGSAISPPPTPETP